MAIKRVNDTNKEKTAADATLEQAIGRLGGNIEPAEADEPDYSHIPTEEEARAAMESQEGMVGQKLQRYGTLNKTDKVADEELRQEKHLSKVGDSIGTNADIREGWMIVNRELLGERDSFYPASWEFRIKPATVEAIRNWSTIDENSLNSVDTVFDEVLKSCLSIRTPQGPLPWSQINTWDRFFFILLIREYTFVNGDNKVALQTSCPDCETDTEVNLTSQSLMFDVPDKDVMDNYDPESRTWTIYPAEYDVAYGDEAVTLYLPTREKDANIKAYYIDKVQQSQGRGNVDRVLFKFLPWLLPKVSKDLTIAKSQIRKAEMEYKSWNVEMFQFMDNVIDNITVTPSSSLAGNCPACGEEVTVPISFPDGIGMLFNSKHRFKKFGKK